jgi:hypothetical protein
MYYQRINPSLGLVEEISLRSGRLYKVLKIDDEPDVECDQLHTRVGFIFYSKSIRVEELSYYKGIDTAMFLPCQPSVKKEICSQVAEGKLITELSKLYIGRLPFPPHEVILKWCEADKEFKEKLAEAKRFSARVRFDQALSIALKHETDPKVLKTLVDVLRRHAEVDDSETFNVKADVPQGNVATVINVYTGVPDREIKDVVGETISGQIDGV